MVFFLVVGIGVGIVLWSTVWVSLVFSSIKLQSSNLIVLTGAIDADLLWSGAN